MKAILKAGALVVLCGTLAPLAFAGDIHCEGEYGDVELDGNLKIAQRCVLNGTEVDGNVKLYEGGSLLAINAEIDGNLDARRADFVEIRNSEIEGNVTLDELVGDISLITDSTIEGKITVKKNRSRIELSRNFVDNNVDANGNSGGTYITNNVIDGNLKCDKNDPAPVLDNNSVAGNLEKQCAESRPAETPSGTEPDTGGTDPDPESDIPPVSTNEPPTLNVGTGGGGSMDIALLVILLAGLPGAAVGGSRVRYRKRVT